MYRPRPYVSFSSMTTFEMSPAKWAEKYLENKRERISRNIALGKKVADHLEADTETGDPMIDMILFRLPKFEIMDKPIEMVGGVEVVDPHTGKTHSVPFLQDGKEKIPLLAKPDSSRKDYSGLKEYKTSTGKWKQKQVDESGQITFYATAAYLATGKIPEDIELCQALTAYDEDRRLYLTGDIFSFKTKRTMVDILKMRGRIKRYWKESLAYAESELL